MAIGFASRYYEPFRILSSKLSAQNSFNLISNTEKGTFSIPYLYENYTNELEPNTISTSIVRSINKYLDENLFNENEKKLLIKEIEPFVSIYGKSIIENLNNRIELSSNQKEHSKLIKEYKKTINALEKIREILKQEFLEGKFMSNNSETEPKVFVSYSHESEEHKNWILQLATRLRANGVNVILDQWNLTLGKDLASFMEKGLSKSQRVICICSEDYIRKADGGIGGSGYEKQIMTSEIIKNQNTDWIIPLIRNNKSEQKTPIFLAGRMYIDFSDDKLYESNYESLLRDLVDEPILPIPPLGKNPFKNIKQYGKDKFIPSSEKYLSPQTSGKVSFDYSNNNGFYSIGQAELLFEIKFSKSSNKSIQVYNDPKNVISVALVKENAEIKEIKDAKKFDTSSRVRVPKINQIVLLQNSNGFFAAIKIISISDDDRGAETDEVVFEYKIQTNGTPDFSI